MISIRRQCELLELNRSNLYYQPQYRNILQEDEIRKAIDKQFVEESCGVKDDALFAPKGLQHRGKDGA